MSNFHILWQIFLRRNSPAIYYPTGKSQTSLTPTHTIGQGEDLRQSPLLDETQDPEGPECEGGGGETSSNNNKNLEERPGRKKLGREGQGRKAETPWLRKWSSSGPLLLSYGGRVGSEWGEGGGGEAGKAVRKELQQWALTTGPARGP